MDDSTYLKKIHDIELDILKNIIQICEDNDIKYFAIGGTLLGAVRHKGFIPWDDDIDIGMPRKDYETFKSIANRLLPNYLRVLDIFDIEHNENMFIKVHNINTTFIEEGFIRFKDRYAGIFVDIMPFDGLPKNLLIKKIYYFKIKLLNRLNKRKRMEKNENSDYAHFISRLFFKKMVNRHGYFYYAEKIEKTRKKYRFDNSKETCFSWSMWANELTFPISIFNELIQLDFEGIKINCPKEYDSYLKIQYGNYMKLPPFEKRTVHRKNGIVDFDKSFISYIKE